MDTLVLEILNEILNELRRNNSFWGSAIGITLASIPAIIAVIISHILSLSRDKKRKDWEEKRDEGEKTLMFIADKLSPLLALIRICYIDFDFSKESKIHEELGLEPFKIDVYKKLYFKFIDSLRNLNSELRNNRSAISLFGISDSNYDEMIKIYDDLSDNIDTFLLFNDFELLESPVFPQTFSPDNLRDLMKKLRKIAYIYPL